MEPSGEEAMGHFEVMRAREERGESDGEPVEEAERGADYGALSVDCL